MQKILLDTNFIITCVKQKIDFVSELEDLFGIYELIVPIEIIGEIKKIARDKRQKLKDRQAAELALEVLKPNCIKPVSLNEKNVDKGIVNFASKHDIIVASLDKNLRQRIENRNKRARFLVIKGKKRLGLL